MNSSLGRRTANFAVTPEESKGKFTKAHNPAILRNKTERKILPLSRNNLVIWAVKRSVFRTFYHAIHSPLLITFHSTERRKHKNNKHFTMPRRSVKIFIAMERTMEVEKEV